MRVIKSHTERHYLIDIYQAQLIEEKIKFHTRSEFSSISTIH